MSIILRKIIILFVFFYAFKSFSQPKQEISLSDSIKTHFYSRPKLASKYLHTYIKLNQKSDNVDNLVLAYTSLAISHELMNNIDSTLFYYYKSLSLLENPIDIIQYKYSIAKIYRDEYNYKDALLLYNQIYDLAREKNITGTISEVNLTIASMKSGLGQPEETLERLRALYTQQKKEKNKDINYTRKKIIATSIQEKKYDLAEALIREGIDVALAANNKEFLYYMYDFRSELDLVKQSYSKAIKHALLALENAESLDNSKFISKSHFRLAEVYFENGQYKDALSYLKKLKNVNGFKKPTELSKYYELKAKTYNALDSSKLSNIYYVKHIEEKEKASKKRLEALASIYDITLKENVTDLKSIHGEALKEEVFEKEKQKKTIWAWTAISIALLVLIVFLFLFFRNKSKVNQKRFDDLMLKINAFEQRKVEENKVKRDEKEKIKSEDEVVELTQTLEKSNVQALSNDQKANDQVEDETETTYIIDDKKVEEILIKLQKLEDKQYYLRQDCTLHNMAKKLKTNTSYLSKIVNTHLDKSFSTYINELRINHAILELKNNKRLRSYSVKGIAGEMGYKNADAFSRYFRDATGITPSVYIKKIEEI